MLRELQNLSCLLIKPAGPDCNLRCTYCFYQDKESLFPAVERGMTCSASHRMTMNTLEVLTKDALTKAKNQFSFIWQGGEPTLMGLPFFEKALKLQKKYGAHLQVANAIQTNGTLIDHAWCDFFKKNDFLVGVSLDGCEKTHNRYRMSKGGAGTHAKVLENAKKMLDAGVNVNALACVTSSSAPEVGENYAFLRDAGFQYMQFIPVIEKDQNGKAMDFSVSPKSYGDFLCALFDLWLEDFKDGKPTTSIRLFDTLFFTLLGQPAPECGSRKTCGLYLAVEHTGDVYPCDFFIEKAHRLGSIQEHSLHDLLNSQKQRLFGGAKACLGNDCIQCQWLGLCGGGCLKDRKNNPDGFETSYFCPSMKCFYAHAVPTLQKIIPHWRG